MDGNICASILRLKASPDVFMYSTAMAVM